MYRKVEPENSNIDRAPGTELLRCGFGGRTIARQLVSGPFCVCGSIEFYLILFRHLAITRTTGEVIDLAILVADNFPVRTAWRRGWRRQLGISSDCRH